MADILSLRTKEKLRDGSYDPDGHVPANHIEVIYSGKPNAKLTITYHGRDLISKELIADRAGNINDIIEVTNPIILPLLNAGRAVSWNCGPPYKFSLGRFHAAVEIT